MSDEQQAPAGSTGTEPVQAEHGEPEPSAGRATGDASTAPAAQPRESSSDTTA